MGAPENFPSPVTARHRTPATAERPDPALTRLLRLDNMEKPTRRRRQAAALLRPLPEQEQFSSCALLTLRAADADPHRTPFVVEHDGVAVGYGNIDALGYLPELTDDYADAALLRAFYIDAAHQDRGHGRSAVRLLPALVREVLPAARVLYLTVNESNPAGIRAYTAGGFTDVGRYLGGQLGPQRVMTIPV